MYIYIYRILTEKMVHIYNNYLNTRYKLLIN